MENFVKKIVEKMKADGAVRSYRRRQRMEEELRREACRRIQVMEYIGGLYISVDGVPVIKESELAEGRNGLLNTVTEARAAYISWKKKEESGITGVSTQY